MPVERGIAMVLGMEPVDAPRLGIDVPIGRRRRAVRRLGARWPPTRSPGTTPSTSISRDPTSRPTTAGAEDKRDVIAAIDAGVLLPRCSPRIDLRRTIVAVTADHSTSCVRKAHTADPVPLVVSGGGVQSDGSTAFGERACADGALGLLHGVEILPRLTALMGS